MIKRIVLLLVIMCSTVALAIVTTQTYKVSFTCTGSTGPFPFAFPISDPTALTVIQNGVTLSPAIYTIVPVNNDYTNGGSVTLLSACTGGYIQVLVRITPITQTILFYDSMPIPMKTFERALDKLTEIDQEIWGGTVHSIQMQNNGANYLLPAVGDITFNFANCVVSGPQGDFTITCPSTAAGGSGVGGYVAGWAGTGATSQIGRVNMIYIGGDSGYTCDDVGINAALIAVGSGVVDARGCTGAHTTAATINIPQSTTLELGPSQWTMNGCPNISMTTEYARLTGQGIASTRLINNTAACSTILAQGLFQEVSGLDLEVAVGVTRTAGAGIDFGQSYTSFTGGHDYFHEMLINVGPYGIYAGSTSGGINNFYNIEFNYAPMNMSGSQAWIFGGVQPYAVTAAANASGGTTVYTGTFPNCAANACVGGGVFVFQGFTTPANNGGFVVSASTTTTVTVNNASGVAESASATAGQVGYCCLASYYFSNIHGNGNTVPPAIAGIVLGSSLDSWNFTTVDIGHNPGYTFTSLLMDETGLTGVAPRGGVFSSTIFEGDNAPAAIINAARYTTFEGASFSAQAATHALLISPTPSLSSQEVDHLIIANSPKICCSQHETVYIDQQAGSLATGITMIGNNIGDASDTNPTTYCDVFVAGGVSDFTFTNNQVHHVFGLTTTPLCSIQLGTGAGTRITVANNNLTDGAGGNSIINGATGPDVNTFPNSLIGTGGNIYRSSGNPTFDVSSLHLGSTTYNGDLAFYNTGGFSWEIGIDPSAAVSTRWIAPLTSGTSGQFLQTQGSSLPMQWVTQTGATLSANNIFTGNNTFTGINNFTSSFLAQGTSIIFGVNGGNSGTFGIEGATLGQITLVPPASFTSWAWRWPNSAGTAGQGLTSQGGSTPMTWTDFPFVTALVTTAATTDNVTVTGMTSSGHCMLQPTNALAAAATGTYVSAKTTNQITVTHAVTASMNYDVLCTSY